MARPTDEPDRNRTLPQAELNPLLNPILGQHMGRWAEVYFTSPPERREEAVMQLLRELESDPAAPREDSNHYRNEVLEGAPAVTAPAPGESPVPRQTAVTCPACTATSPADQIFCGGCGAPLREGSARAGIDTRDWPAAPSATPSRDRETRAPSRREQPELPPAQITPSPSSVYDYPRAIWPSGELASELARQRQSVLRRYRIAGGAGLVILVGVMAYMIWRGSQSFTGNASAIQSAPAAVQVQPPPKITVPESATPESAAPGSGAPGSGAPGSRAPVSHPATVAPSTQSAPSQLLPPAAVPLGTGAEELATAEQYLNGTGGKARDSAEAAKWLWKSVGKQNAAATVLLSDLYLRGDGVTRSCDQAHLLLDAAARKNAPGAAERLRNLQAFGCP